MDQICKCLKCGFDHMTSHRQKSFYQHSDRADYGGTAEKPKMRA